MQSLSRAERAALCNAALESGPDAATLCGDWTVRDLVVHLLVRERDPLGAPGILVPRLDGLTARSSRRLADHDFSALVERLRGGPPVWSPMALPALDRAANTLEYFVHHEDIRRARAGWEPRELPEHDQRTLFRAISMAGRGLVRPAGVPVTIRVTTEQPPNVLRKGADPVVLTGPPSEIALFCFGRTQVAGLSFAGPPEAVRRLREARLGI